MRDLQAIQADINMMDQAIQNAGMGVDTSSWLSEKEKYEREFVEATAYWDNQQNLQHRVDQAKETGYFFDTLKTSNGLTMAELSYSPENHELQAIAVQIGFLAQEDAFNSTINNLEYELTQERIQTNDLNDHIERMEQIKYQSDLETADLQTKLKNAAAIIEEKDAEIARLKEQKQGNSPMEIAVISAEEREAKLINDLNGKQIKVTNLRPKTDEFNNKLFIATNALTGVEFEDYLLYSKRYEVISEESAEQLRAEYVAKKAELENIIPVQPPEVQPVDAVLETVEASEMQPFPEKEVQASDNGDLQGDQGNESLHEVVSEESQVTYVTQKDLQATLITVYAVVDQLAGRVTQLESEQRAVA